MKKKSAQEHVDRYAERFADELQPILHLDGITQNTDLLGAYTEAALRNLIRHGFQPLQVCRGGVLDYPQKKLAQADIIIWSPHPAPPIFNVEGFGLVPRSSVFGIMEVKKEQLQQCRYRARQVRIRLSAITVSEGPVFTIGDGPAT
jgi:hypothetical protein